MNLFSLAQPPSPGSENFETLHHDEHVKIERITSNSVKKGEWYDQDHDEWVTLLQGEAVLEFKEGSKRLTAGDTLFIEKHLRHRVLETSAYAIWLVVHLS